MSEPTTSTTPVISGPGIPAPVREPIPVPPSIGNIDPTALPFRDDFAFLDTETTGIDPDADGICEIAIVRFRDGVPEVWHSLVNPGFPIPPTASAVHNITDADVADAPTLEELLPRIKEMLKGAEVVAHNAKFDAAFIQPKLGETYDPSKWVCSYRLSRHVFKEAPAHGNMVLRYWLKTDPRSEGLGAHRAIDDVWVSIENFRHMLLQCSHTHGLTNLAQVREKANEVIPVLIFPFGKNIDKPLTDIPTDYFDWCFENFEEWDPDLKASVIMELQRRGHEPKEYKPKQLGADMRSTVVTPAPTCPFRKHEGKAWNLVPTDYLDFLVQKNVRMDQSVRMAIDLELARRKAGPVQAAAPSPAAASAPAPAAQPVRRAPAAAGGMERRSLFARPQQEDPELEEPPLEQEADGLAGELVAAAGSSTAQPAAGARRMRP